MKASRGRVLDKFQRIFAAHPDAEALWARLNLYGSREGDRERERVQLAILKLCGGDPAKLHSYVETALLDYRDVLAWAEYPEQMSTGKTAYNTSEAELGQIRRRDQDQYLAWLADDGEEGDKC